MLAISTDIDSTTIDGFRYIHSTLKNPDNGIGLDVADSIWALAKGAQGGSQLAFMDIGTLKPTPYWRELKFYRDKGWIDTLHTYGNFSHGQAGVPEFTREYAQRAKDFFSEHGLKFEVWVNHGDEANVQNIGFYKYTQGDNPDSAAYHTDLTRDLGVRYIWNPHERRTFGHDSLLIERELTDGSKIWSFPRFHSVIVSDEERGAYDQAGCKYWGAEQNEAVLWYPDALHLQLRQEYLEKLCREEKFAIVTQHLGYAPKLYGRFTEQMFEAFGRLKAFEERGQIKVVPTSLILNYNRVRDFVEFRVINRDSGTIIDIEGVRDPLDEGSLSRLTVAEARGLTFYCEKPGSTFIAINGTLVHPSRLVRAPDDGFAPSIGIAWYADDTDDLTLRYAALQVLAGEKRSEPHNASEPNSGRHDRAMPAASRDASVRLWERASAKAREHGGGDPPEDLVPAICIGGMKCGTTTLWNLLEAHPEILRTAVKEPTYFGRVALEQLSREEYLSLWPWPKEQHSYRVAFEVSTHYAKYPASGNVAEQMHAIVPEAKLIYLMRHPVRRLESQLAHHIARGEMPFEDFRSGLWRQNAHLFNLSSYALQLEQFNTLFPREQILPVLFEDLIDDSDATLARIYRFLGVAIDVSYPKPSVSNPRRSDFGADSVYLSNEDEAYVIEKLRPDIERLVSEFGVDTTPWSL